MFAYIRLSPIQVHCTNRAGPTEPMLIGFDFYSSVLTKLSGYYLDLHDLVLHRPSLELNGLINSYGIIISCHQI